MRNVTEVLVVGAGFAGIAMAMALRHAGRDDVTVIERGASVGGTWRDNTYPGVACDVPSHLYGFAGHPNPAWSGIYASGSEIHRYLQDVVGVEGLSEKLWLDAAMVHAAWDDQRAIWQVDTSRGEFAAEVLVLACGRLAEPSIPDLPGLDSFPGPIFHSSRWDHSVGFSGARVGVVGTGASAVQIVPELARAADHVTLFQRTPAWILPRGNRTYSDKERGRFATHPAELEALRAALYAEGEARHASRSGGAAATAVARDAALRHLESQVSDPELRVALTPDYGFGCKRVLLSDDFYPAVASSSVTLESSALVGVDGATLISESGDRHEVDVLVLATGFNTTCLPYAERVYGEAGFSLADHWSDGMTSFGSTVVSGFPNMFILDGPNAALAHNSSVLMIEEQAAYVVRCLAHRDRDRQPLRLNPSAEVAYTEEIAIMAAATPWITGGCRNWYVDERSGRLSLLWPGTVDAFRARLGRAHGSEFSRGYAAATHGGASIECGPDGSRE